MAANSSALLLLEAHVRGRVVDAAEHALAGVTLSLARGPEFAEPLPLDPWGDVRTVTSGTDGSFEIGALPPGDLRLSALDPRWRAQDALITGLRPGEDRAGVRVHLARAAALHGTVADEYALGVPGVRVTAGARSGMGNVQVTTTDQAGHYRFDSLAPGDYVLCASLDDRAARSRSVLTLGEANTSRPISCWRAASDLVIDVRGTRRRPGARRGRGRLPARRTARLARRAGAGARAGHLPRRDHARAGQRPGAASSR